MTRDVLRATSVDGTVVGATRTGEGPPLLVVHGIAADSGRFSEGAPPRLEQHFTVFAMDRRGRGASGDAKAYAVAREAEDVAAMIDAIAEATQNERIFVFGHSFGGLVCLDALPRTPRIAKLVVYEPYAPPVPSAEPAPITLEYMALAEAGELEALTTRFLHEIVRMPDADVARLRAHASWPARVAVARTIPREMDAAGSYAFAPSRYAANAVPVRMLLGGASPSFLREATERLHRGIPASAVHELPGQGHIAMDTAPEMFLAALRDFLG